MSRIGRLRWTLLSRGTSRHNFLSLSLTASVLAIPCARLDGAEIRFDFEATISQVQGDVIALNLPFALNVGQRIEGRYVFSSAEDLLDVFLHHGRGKQGKVTLAIDGTEIEAAVNLGWFNFGGLPDINSPPLGFNSSLSLGYLSPTDVFPGWGGYLGVGHPWGAGLTLVGVEGTVSRPDDVLNVDTWNKLTTLRRLEFQIGYPDSVWVQAMVGDFSQIPEPSNAVLACLAGVLAPAAWPRFKGNSLTRPRRNMAG